jgi:hypothetical protein
LCSHCRWPRWRRWSYSRGAGRSFSVLTQIYSADWISEQAHTKPTPLTRPVYVVVRTSAECVGEPLLAALSVHDGPAAGAIQFKIGNLLTGEAWDQSVAILVEEETDTPLAVATVCLDGHPNGWTFPLAYTKRISGNPHVNILARDDRFRNRTLLDGQTRLGTAALHAMLEVVLRDRPSAPGVLPLTWGFVDPDNSPGIHAFETTGFHEHKRNEKERAFIQSASGLFVPVPKDLVLARANGKRLPTIDEDAYRPVLTGTPAPPASESHAIPFGGPRSNVGPTALIVR